MTMMIEIKNISKRYSRAGEEFTALSSISLTINKGDYIVVTGASGAGKSTLLYSIGGLIRPDSGEVMFNGKDLYRNDGAELATYRKINVGFMFQQFHLMPYLTVYENIKLACYDEKYLADIDTYLERCSLAELKNKYPSELSVGEKQRTAFIRAIITRPGILLADEPTGNLDPANSSILFRLIDDFHKNGGTIVVVTHDPVPVKYSNRNVMLDKGKIIS
ncbi:MAG TPA: ABC transporter ATP-binding protein [Bacteroidales bacterium]|nr:ABC transporter ATP-binding protein [Bacteroidales bacterium]